jgi:hypothetical protein
MQISKRRSFDYRWQINRFGLQRYSLGTTISHIDGPFNLRISRKLGYTPNFHGNGFVYMLYKRISAEALPGDENGIYVYILSPDITPRF